MLKYVWSIMMRSDSKLWRRRKRKRKKGVEHLRQTRSGYLGDLNGSSNWKNRKGTFYFAYANRLSQIVMISFILITKRVCLLYCERERGKRGAFQQNFALPSSFIWMTFRDAFQVLNKYSIVCLHDLHVDLLCYPWITNLLSATKKKLTDYVGPGHVTG